MSKRVGVPVERKPQEGRVALTPQAVGELVVRGAEVGVERGAGNTSGYPDSHYAAAGARLFDDASALFGWSEIVVKVKEPIDVDLAHLRAEHLLFCYLHLAANPTLIQRLCDIGLTAIAFETVADGGRLPILTPMSQIAGRIAVQVGTHLLHTPQGGRGVLLGGLPGVDRGHVVVLGGGVAGGASVELAAAQGAQVTVFDRDPRRLDAMHRLGANVTARQPAGSAIAEAVADADLLIGAVLLPGAAAPRLVSREEVRAMRRGSVIADIAVDQGGCIETTRATTYDAPTYVDEGVVHFCVSNMPGAVPRSASQALSSALLPYLQVLLGPDWRQDDRLARAVNVAAGEIVLPALHAHR